MKTVLAQVGIGGNGDVSFQHYSEGVNQELALARALLTDPAILFLDEPTQQS